MQRIELSTCVEEECRDAPLPWDNSSVQITYQAQPLTEAMVLALKSRKFREWQRALPVSRFATIGGYGRDGHKPNEHDAALVGERHYTPKQLADTWGLAPDTIRELFESEPGVLVIGSNGTRNKRRYRTFRIPESVAFRVHRKLSAKP
jgi:hypothetical protein